MGTTMTAAASQIASFRDPAGRLLQREGRIFRSVSERGLENAQLFLRSPAIGSFREAGRVVGADAVPDWEAAGLGLRGCRAGSRTSPHRLSQLSLRVGARDAGRSGPADFGSGRSSASRGTRPEGRHAPQCPVRRIAAGVCGRAQRRTAGPSGPSLAPHGSIRKDFHPPAAGSRPRGESGTEPGLPARGNDTAGDDSSGGTVVPVGAAVPDAGDAAGDAGSQRACRGRPPVPAEEKLEPGAGGVHSAAAVWPTAPATGARGAPDRPGVRVVVLPGRRMPLQRRGPDGKGHVRGPGAGPVRTRREGSRRGREPGPIQPHGSPAGLARDGRGQRRRW